MTIAFPIVMVASNFMGQLAAAIVVGLFSAIAWLWKKSYTRSRKSNSDIKNNSTYTTSFKTCLNTFDSTFFYFPSYYP